MLVVGVLAAGALVAAAAFLASRSGNVWAGFVAAAPITPTLAVLNARALSPEDLLGGLPVVAAATACMASSILLQRQSWMPTPAIVLLLGLPLLLPAMRLVPRELLFGAIILGCLVVDVEAAKQRLSSPPRRMPWYVAGLVGAGIFAGLMAAASVWPSTAAILAMYPALLVISLASIRLTSGRQAAPAVCRSALGANVAVAGFAAVPSLLAQWRPSAPVSMGLSWLVFAAIAASWPFLVQLMRPKVLANRATVSPGSGP